MTILAVCGSNSRNNIDKCQSFAVRAKNAGFWVHNTTHGFWVHNITHGFWEHSTTYWYLKSRLIAFDTYSLCPKTQSLTLGTNTTLLMC